MKKTATTSSLKRKTAFNFKQAENTNVMKSTLDTTATIHTGTTGLK